AERGEPDQTGSSDPPAPASVRGVDRAVLRVHVPVHYLARTDGERALDLDPRVVDELERIRIAHLDINVAALFGDDVEHGCATELIGLTHDREVPTCDIPHATGIDVERALCGGGLGERRSDLVADDQLGACALAGGGPGFRGGGRDIALVLVSYRHRDRHTASHVVEGVLNGPGPATVRQPVQRKAKILALVAQVEACVPASVGFFSA